jgi:hypothetical protein
MREGAQGQVLLATDLDRTLMWSLVASGLPTNRLQWPPLVSVETFENREHSFVTARAASMVEAMNLAGDLVPVTTRTLAQYQRVRLPGPPPRYAVCLNGGRLLVDGREDMDFTSRVAGRLADVAPFGEVHARLAEVCAAAGQFVKALREAEGVFCYAVLFEPGAPEGWLAEVQEVARVSGWKVSVQGRKVYCVPDSLTKAHAVEEVRERVGASRLHAAGDSTLDADLLEAADRGLMPGGSELARSGWQRDHVQVTSSTGVLAGEEIAAWLHAAFQA